MRPLFRQTDFAFFSSRWAPLDHLPLAVKTTGFSGVIV